MTTFGWKCRSPRIYPWGASLIYLRARVTSLLHVPLPRLLADEAQLDLGSGARVGRVPFEAGALEVLYSIHFSVGGADFGQFFGDGVAERREASLALPVAQKRLLPRVPGL